MKINNKDKIKWKDFSFDSNDMLEDDLFEYESVKRALSEEAFEDGFSVNGLLRRWSGFKEINAFYVNNLEELIDKFKNMEDITVNFDKDSNCFDVHNIHHDGTNRYYMTPLKWLTKSEIKDEFKIDSVSFWNSMGVNLNKCNREELLEYIRN